MLILASMIGTRRPAASGRREIHWLFQLYVVGRSPRGIMTLGNLRKICDEHLPGQYTIEVIDLQTNPGLAAENRIIAVPTLIRRSPEPVRRIIGDLSNTAKVLVGLDITKVA